MSNGKERKGCKDRFQNSPSGWQISTVYHQDLAIFTSMARSFRSGLPDSVRHWTEPVSLRCKRRQENRYRSFTKITRQLRPFQADKVRVEAPPSKTTYTFNGHDLQFHAPALGTGGGASRTRISRRSHETSSPSRLRPDSFL